MRVIDRLDTGLMRELIARDEFFWADLHAPSDADVRALGEALGLHPLAIEDTLAFGQRPKLDDYGSAALLVFHGARRGDAEAGTVEFHMFVAGGWIVTVHRDPCAELDAVRAELGASPMAEEQLVVYRVVDAITDTFFPVIDAIEDEIDDLHVLLLDPRGGGDDALATLLRLRRELVALRRVAVPQRDIFPRATALILEVPGLEPSTRDYLRDVDDHLARIVDRLEASRELVASAMDVSLSVASNRLNVVISRLTLVATVFLPLTFVTGFFGQNFGWLVDHVDSLEAFLVWGVGGLVASAVLLLVWFRRVGVI